MLFKNGGHFSLQTGLEVLLESINDLSRTQFEILCFIPGEYGPREISMVQIFAFNLLGCYLKLHPRRHDSTTCKCKSGGTRIAPFPTYGILPWKGRWSSFSWTPLTLWWRSGNRPLAWIGDLPGGAFNQENHACTRKQHQPPLPTSPRVWTPEERDSFPLTPRCWEITGVERGRSEESLGWNVVWNTPPDNIASGKPRIRDLTERGRPRSLANPPVRTSKGFCLRRYRTPSPHRFRTPQALTSLSTSILPCPQKQGGQHSVGTLASHTLAVPSPSHHTPKHHPGLSPRERVRITSRHLKWWDSDGLGAFWGPSPSLPRDGTMMAAVFDPGTERRQVWLMGIHARKKQDARTPSVIFQVQSPFFQERECRITSLPLRDFIIKC